MSLQQAALMTSNPLLRGLQAGQSAYNSPLATSIEASLDQAQQQRASLGLNPASSVPLSGTSAAAYQYLHGQGSYPYTQSNQGPTTVSYEQAHGITGPQSQAALAQAAKDAPWRGTSGSPQSTVKTKPSAGSELAGLAMPAALAYKYLATPEMKKWVADKTGFDIFGPSTKEAATLGKTTGATTGATTSGPLVGGPTNTTNPADWAASQAEADAAGTYGTYGPTATQYGAMGEAPLTASAAAPATGLEFAMNPMAGEVGYVYNPVTGALTGATEAQIAAASIPTAAEGVSAIEAANAAQAANELALAADATAGAEGSALMAVDPYTAGLAALLAMTPGGQNILGKLTGAVTGVVGGVGDLVTSGVNTVANAVGDAVDTATNWVSDLFDWKEGGEINSITGALAHKHKYSGGGLPTPPQNFNLGGYSDGGRLLRGPGDGVSDSIPATIGQNKQPARLADGEFVVPARIVSELGNGSTEAGARKLYAMMDRIQAGRKKSVGKGKVAVNSRADKHLPA